jgi:hypothetical protein
LARLAIEAEAYRLRPEALPEVHFRENHAFFILFSSEGVICSQLSGDFTELVQGSSNLFDDFLGNDLNGFNVLNGLNRRLVSRPMRRIRAFHL